jgi:Holliday junction resolvase RusA-like endonuclease
MTEADLRKHFPHASAATINRNLGDTSPGLRPDQPQRIERSALDLPPQGKKKGRSRPVPDPERYRIVFHVYSVRPFDWDNYSTKELQDVIVKAGILHDDNWRELEGSIVPHKAEGPEEERTVVEITRLL